MNDRERFTAFLKDLTILTRKHKVVISRLGFLDCDLLLYQLSDKQSENIYTGIMLLGPYRVPYVGDVDFRLKVGLTDGAKIEGGVRLVPSPPGDERREVKSNATRGKR